MAKQNKTYKVQSGLIHYEFLMDPSPGRSTKKARKTLVIRSLVAIGAVSVTLGGAALYTSNMPQGHSPSVSHPLTNLNP